MSNQLKVHPVKPKVLLVYRRYASSFTAYPWILGRAGKIEVHTLAPESHAIRHSTWVDRIHLFREDSLLLERLTEVLEQDDYTAMLCVDEPAREAVLEHCDNPVLKPFLPFPEGSPLFEAAVNKVSFQKWCAAHGLETPRSVFCSSVEAVAQAAQEFAYPFVLKGAHGAGGQQVHIVGSNEQLESLLQLVAVDHDEEWIVQEFLTGAVGTTLFVARNGKLYAHCSVKNRVCMHGGIGPSAICQFVVDPALEKIAGMLAPHMDGLTGVDWMHTEDGRFVLIDPHFGRATPNAVIAHLDGVDFGDAYFRSLVTQEPALCVPKNSSLRVWLMPKSLNLLFEGRLGEALRVANPSSKQVRVFWGGAKEWRLVFALTSELLSGNLRVLLGRIRNKLFCSKGSVDGDMVSADISNF